MWPAGRRAAQFGRNLSPSPSAPCTCGRRERPLYPVPSLLSGTCPCSTETSPCPAVRATACRRTPGLVPRLQSICKITEETQEVTFSCQLLHIIHTINQFIVVTQATVQLLLNQGQTNSNVTCIIMVHYHGTFNTVTELCNTFIIVVQIHSHT